MDFVGMTDCLWDNQVLGLSLQDVSRLPDEVLDILTHGTNAQYLAALSKLALNPTWTEVLFARYEPLFAELGGRLASECTKDPDFSIQAIRTLSRLLPFCPRLAVHIQDIVSNSHYFTADLPANSGRRKGLSELSSSDACQALISLLRLLDFDHHGFSRFVYPSQIHGFLAHEDHALRYLACRVLALLYHFTTRSLAEHVERYCESGPLKGSLDGIEIDFRFLDAWEIQRRRNLRKILKTCRNQQSSIQNPRRIIAADLCSRSVDLAGYIAPRLGIEPPPIRRIVLCSTAQKNLKSVAEAICSGKPALIIGSSGSGKTAMIEEVASQLDQSSKMLTLRLNAQTDARLLIGLYGSDLASGSFRWQPGILTTAVLEGRWVLIEDLDRAPSEVMSVLLPLLDNRELMVPNLGGTIRAAPGFKIIGTIRSTTTFRLEGEEVIIPDFLGTRHWKKVFLDHYTSKDLQQILSSSFPLIHRLQDRILSMYNTVKNFTQNSNTKQSRLRTIGLQELLRFCTRCSNVLQAHGLNIDTLTFPTSVDVQIFLEAVDIFSGSIPAEDSKRQMVNLVAQELHVSAETVRFCVDLRVPNHERRSKSIVFGRVDLPVKSAPSHGISKRVRLKHPFAITNHSLRYIESIASAVRAKESCLLVGETGTGKTTIVQELANAVGQDLFVVNLSQQSEVGDLLGGFKPFTLKVLAVAIKEKFDTLFDDSLKSSKNAQFMNSLDRHFKKEQWLKVLKLWTEACKTASAALVAKANAAVNPSKKRKADALKYEQLRNRWSNLSSDMELFRKHLERGSKGFAFSFVEGNLVKALKNGSWILLDEINLATPDTLEVLADLLSFENHKSPSLLLTEAGNIERIQAHPDFQIFAAMNPATDIGKRELSSSIRSLFSEYYISSCENDFDSLLQICSAYLGDFALSDTRIAPEVANLFQAIRKLEKDNKLVDGANQKPHFTLRTLSRTLSYAMDIVNIYGLRRSLYEGFCMTFLTLLDRPSISLVSPLIYHYLLASQKNIRSILHQIPKCPGDSSQYVQFRHYWMAKGSFDIVEQPHYIITPFVEANLLNLVRATSTRRYPVLLQGPTSSGKTSMVEYLANISGNKFVRINNHEHTDLQEYFGTYVSGTNGLQFQDGVLVKALREGQWLVLDELNLAPSDILEALNRLLDDNRELLIPETQEIVRPHPEFMLFATQNPPGLYGGRKALSRAFRNRFLELHFDDIPENELETILIERTQIAPSYCSRIVEVYRRLTILRQSNRLFEQKNSFATLRDLFRWALRDADNVEQLASNGFMLIAERIRDHSERQAVQAIIEEVMKVKINESRLYNLDDGQIERIKSSGPVSKGISMTRAMRRVYALVSAALKNKEPVLLIGDTGCGKTTISQVIAEVIGTKLHILNAHKNTETGDIIGALRPVRNKVQITSELRALLERAYLTDTRMQANSDLSLDELTRWYEVLPDSRKSQMSEVEQSRVATLIAKSKALFEWADGSLVTAMRSGHHFLLDEISLADDSVLERLNSVLEPSRTLLLAEKGTVESFVVAHSQFQFLATMNPGGDYGKKELSPALRNRFTEIWVPQLSDDEDLCEIVSTKLSAALHNLVSPIISFAKWFQQVCGDSQSVVSLRQILAWVEFINIDYIESMNTRLVHGAAMVYVDGIGADPSAKVYLSQADIDIRRRLCLDQLEALFQIPAHEIYNANVKVSLSHDEWSIGPFKLKHNQAITSSPSFSLNAPTTIQNALRVLRALQIPKPILVEGSPGVGKTSLIEAIAQLTTRPLTRINLSDQTDLMDLFGSDVPSENGSIGDFEWRDAPFLTAMQNGEWVLLDEMNLASQPVLEGLNACLDHRGEVYIPELDRSFVKHPHFMLFAAQNPHAQGGGRKGLPASFVNRFTVVFAEPLNEKDIIKIATELHPNVVTGVTESLASYISSLNRLVSGPHAPMTAGGPWEFNLRDMLRWMSLVEKQGSILGAATPGDFENMLVLSRLRTSEDRMAVSSIIPPPCLKSSRIRLQYKNSGSRSLQCGFGMQLKSSLSNVSIHHFHSHDPEVFESVMIAIEQNWPCLLVGASGSGKSTLIQAIASELGASVTTLALNSETDTMDIVGGFEQVDHTRHKEKILKTIRSRISFAWSQSTSYAFEGKLACIWSLLSQRKTNIIALVKELKSQEFEGDAELAELTQQLEQVSSHEAHGNHPGFAWIDGVLIEAMERGDWLVLDNANLCNPSVLDRLNALLEPNGILSLHEHRLEGGSPQMTLRHSKFRIFLTIDPRHGELSRAMRNRCVELYLRPHGNLQDSDQILTSFKCDTTLDFVEKFEWDKLSMDEVEALLLVSLSRLSIVEHDNFTSWYEQVINGLYSMEQRHCLLLKDMQSSFQLSQAEVSAGDILRKIYVEYLGISDISESQYSSIIADQSIDPTANSALLSLAQRHDSAEFLALFTDLCQARFQLRHLQQRLSTSQQVSLHKSRHLLSPLERSLIAYTDRKFAGQASAPISTLLSSTLKALETYLVAQRLSSQSSISKSQELIDYCRDLCDLADNTEFDDSVLFTFVRRGWTLHRSLLAPKNAILSNAFENSLSLFGDVVAADNMEILWTYLKPATPKDLDELSRLIKLENLAARLDTILLRSTASVASMAEMKRPFYQRSRFIRAYNEPRLQELEDIVLEEEKSTSLEPAAMVPYFRNEFEILIQQIFLAGEATEFDKLQDLCIVAGQDACYENMLSDPASQTYDFSTLGCIAGNVNSASYLGAIRSNLSATLIEKLVRFSSTSLRQFHRLQDELHILCGTIVNQSSTFAADQSHFLRQLLNKLMLAVLKAYQNRMPANVFGAWSVCLEESQTLGDGHHRLPPLVLSDMANGRSNAGWTMLSSAFNRTLELQTQISYPSKKPQDFKATLGQAWIDFSLACLNCYIPSHPLDPALGPRITNQMWHKRKTEIENETLALERYERNMTGQPTGFRRQILARRLDMLGAEPTVLSIARPVKSNIIEIFNDLTNVSTTVLQICATKDLHNILFDDKRIGEIQRHIATNITRLQNGPQEYKDILQPAVGFLQALDIGLALKMSSNRSPTILPRLPADSITTYNLFGIKIDEILGSNVHNSLMYDLKALDHRYIRLRMIELTKNIEDTITQPAVRMIVELFEQFFQEWKSKLLEDQSNEASRSSVYHFKGNTETDNSDAAELETLFPTFDSDQPPSEKSTRISPSKLSQILAGIHANIFLNEATERFDVRSFVADISERLVSKTSKLQTNDCPVIAEDLLPGVLQHLYYQWRHITVRVDTNAKDFYHQPNLRESSRLTALARRLRIQFKDLRNTWPEHATIGHVLLVIEHVLDSKLDDPLAKLIIIAEKLHEFVNEWQTMASREFSVISLHDELTQLLVDWRRNELSTWSRLLDREEQKHAEEAKSWWFVAYEAILHPLSTLDMPMEQARLFAIRLSDELHKFLRTASLGQFATRLTILAAFHRQVVAISKFASRMLPISDVLYNTIEYFKRWQDNIIKEMKQQRSSLDAKMKDIILLASWKDTNITALRASSQRSHRSLFKIVKKYRGILALPVETLLADVTKDLNPRHPQGKPPTLFDDTLNIQAALSTISSVSDFLKKFPRRLLDPIGTASVMARVGRIPMKDFDPATYLESVHENLRSSIKHLRQETPTQLTEGTKVLVRHLKTRKRNLLADTLKELRTMGIRTNLNTDALAAQDSTSKALAKLPNEARLVDSTSDLYMFLDDMAYIRINARQHSNDLSPSEMLRCLGSLEGVLYQMLRQHRVLSTGFRRLNACDDLLALLRLLWQPSNYDVLERAIDSEPMERLRARLNWILAIISTAKTSINMTADMAQLSYSDLMSSFDSYEARIASLISSLDQLPDLSVVDLMSSLEANHLLNVNDILKSIQMEIRKFGEQHPNLRFILNHVIPWIDIKNPINPTANSVGLSQRIPLSSIPTETEHQQIPTIETMIKQMLVGLQKNKTILEGLPATAGSAGWLVKTEDILERASKGLQIDYIAGNFRLSLVDGIHSDQNRLTETIAIIALALPILQQYRDCFAEILEFLKATHTSFSSLATTMSLNFKQIVSQGFCSPKEKPAQEQDNNQTEGVGLGEGEGAEDMSKDIEDEENISELAQNVQEEKDVDSAEPDLDKEDNAIDLGDEDLNGQFDAEGEERDNGEGNDDESQDDYDDVSEEIGSVDDLDPSAVDEKLWEDEAEKDQRQKDGKAESKQSKEDKLAAEEDRRAEALSDGNREEDELDEHDLGTDQMEQLDPHINDEDKLELPDDIQLDGVRPVDSDEEISDGLSDVGDEKTQEENIPDDHSEDVNMSSCDQQEEHEDEKSQQDSAERPSEDHMEQQDLPEEDQQQSEVHEVKSEEDASTLSNNQFSEEQGSKIDTGEYPENSDDIHAGAREIGTSEMQSKAKESQAANSGLETDETSQIEPHKVVDIDEQRVSSKPETNLDPFRKLSEALEKWRRSLNIRDATNNQPPLASQQTEDIQHLRDDGEIPDAQALGPAGAEEARALTRDEYEMEIDGQDPEAADVVEQEHDQDLDMEEPDAGGDLSQVKADTMIGNRASDINIIDQRDNEDGIHQRSESLEDLDEIDSELSEVKLTTAASSQTSVEQARSLWQQCESSTGDLALTLTEELRLILAPSLATKMRGDFRTGKRLNIKRIIPYIASGYKRDKIWMRRSTPSKRSYQVMLAVDDSKSMSESGSSKLAFETLALLTRSLSMLEVGQICIASFGEDFHIAHGFEQQFSTEAAIKMFQHFTFDQTKTNVRNLMASSLNAFREARAKQSASNTELWQLQLIISDGVCEDHDSIRRLVRQAHEERIMIVFAVINSAGNHSILNMTQASFEPDENGETKLKIKRYLDGFPFTYYLIVGDIKNLPGVLSMALRQWFAEVADST